VPFHFLPGGEGDSASERLICKPGSAENVAASRVIDFAKGHLKETFGWHLLGIVSHVIQDTYSHWGFSGISSPYNMIEQGDIVLSPSHDAKLMDAIQSDAGNFWESLTASVAEDVSSLGHGSAATYPDRPYLLWEFDYEMSIASCPRKAGELHCVRDNPKWFLDSCERLYDVFAAIACTEHSAAPKPFAEISPVIDKILRKEARVDARADAWREVAASGQLFPADGADREIRYVADCWVPGKLRTKPRAEKEQAQLFFKASRRYRCHVLNEILPSLGIL
jgi:hypothetical protein